MEQLPFDKRSGKIWFNNKLVEWQDARVHVISHGMHYASLVFEGLRVYNKKIFKLEDHTKRLFHSARRLDIQVPYSEKIKKDAEISSMAVGAIISADQANEIISNKRADLVAMGRELLADTQWVYKAATYFNLENAKDYLPDSYSFYLSRRDEYLDRAAKPA